MSDLPKDIDPNFPFWVVEEDNGSLTFHWDEDHPVTSVFNSWTGDDFIRMLVDNANEIIEGIETLNKN